MSDRLIRQVPRAAGTLFVGMAWGFVVEAALLGFIGGGFYAGMCLDRWLFG